MTKISRLLAFTALLCGLPAWAGAPPSRADAVLVLGALHDLHRREESFGYARLRDILKAFRPDIVVLEVRPDELASRARTPGRPEYPEAIWGWLSDARVEAIAMEPGGHRFKVITANAGAAFSAFEKRDAPGAAALAGFDAALETTLLQYWRSPSQTQDQTTARLVDGYLALRAALVGPAFTKAQAAWDQHMGEIAVQTVRANPGKRILVIGSYRNRLLLENAIRERAARRIVKAADWLLGIEKAPVGPAEM